MGNAASEEDQQHLDHDGDDEFAEFDGIDTLGYRVLGVQPNSPASTAGLVSFFDFLVGANGQMLLGSGEGLEEGEEYDDIDFPAMLRENKGKPIELLVWNIKSQEQRFVDLTPDDNWGGAGLLGVTIRLDNYGGADERLIRVLEVSDNNSPAAIAGLQPLKDYLLGTTAIAFGSTKQLAETLELNLDRVVEIYVYNSDSDKVRVISLLPTYNWGDNGRGMLGAEVGTGYLHRLPKSCRSTVGTSVERKVRLAITKNNATTTTTAVITNGGENSNPVTAAANSGGGVGEDSSSSGGDTSAAAAATGTHQQQQQQSGGEVVEEAEVTLEVEPHLEMEAEKDSEGKIQNVEELTKQPHQLGNEEEVVQKEESTTPPTTTTTTSLQQEQQQQPGGDEESESLPSSGSNVPKTTTTTETSSSSIPTSSFVPPEDAEALFSGPPPTNSSSSGGDFVDSNSSLEVQIPNRDQKSTPSNDNNEKEAVNNSPMTTTTTNFSGLPTPPKMNY